VHLQPDTPFGLSAHPGWYQGCAGSQWRKTEVSGYSPDPGRLVVPGGAALYGPVNWSGVVLKVIRATLVRYAWVSARNTPPAG